MKNKRLHIHQFFAVLMLWVFAIALVPWGTLHHHAEEEPNCAKYGKICMHKTHIGNESHNCLICSAHFEKDYYTSSTSFHVKLTGTVFIRTYALSSASYTALRGSSLRGPPVV
ncbi:hypothetical protein [Pedobacter hartonius]|uniref:hypothetical protein n=1 Tax=Pedobacter hartonius TaxID=425514 RepID=UPI0011152B85|nr:hypothetical protein [Pedobacter hartonius]